MISERQREVLKYFYAAEVQRLQVPSYRDLAKLMDVTSSTITDYIKILVRDRWIEPIEAGTTKYRLTERGLELARRFYG